MCHIGRIRQGCAHILGGRAETTRKKTLDGAGDCGVAAYFQPSFSSYRHVRSSAVIPRRAFRFIECWVDGLGKAQSFQVFSRDDMQSRAFRASAGSDM